MDIKYSSISYKTVRKNSDFRIDAQFYNPEALKIHKKIKSKNGILFSSLISKISSGQNLPQDAEGKYKFVRTKNIKSIIIEDRDMSFTNELHGLQPTVEGELLFVRVGEPGNNCIVTKAYQGESISDNILRIKLQNINPYFCSAFFNSKSGKIYFNRVLKGTAQGLISQENFNEILIPNFPSEFQNLIQYLVIAGENYIEESKKSYFKADQSIFTEINVEEKNLKHELTFTKKMRDIKEHFRIDAEHYQPKYEEPINKIKNYKSGFSTLGELLHIREKSFFPIDNQKYKYIEISNITSSGFISGCTESVGKELPTRARRKVSIGDVIVSSVEGSTESVALITEEWDGALCSNGFFVINSKTINSETLFMFFKSKIGQMQLKKQCRGAILAAMRTDDFLKICIPNFTSAFQEEIKDKVEKMYEAKRKSQCLIETAIHGVEIAIEKDEKEAEKWIHARLKELNITL